MKCWEALRTTGASTVRMGSPVESGGCVNGRVMAFASVVWMKGDEA
jgi:hypothetical protein